MKTDQYYMYKGQLYVKTGVSGRIVTTDIAGSYLDNPKYEIVYEYVQAFDEKGDTVDGKALLKINSDKRAVYNFETRVCMVYNCCCAKKVKRAG